MSDNPKPKSFWFYMPFTDFLFAADPQSPRKVLESKIEYAKREGYEVEVERTQDRGYIVSGELKSA